MLNTMILVFVQGSISFLVGFCLVLLGWAILGMIVEAYGFIVLFRFTSHPLLLSCFFLFISFIISIVASGTSIISISD